MGPRRDEHRHHTTRRIENQEAYSQNNAAACLIIQVSRRLIAACRNVSDSRRRMVLAVRLYGPRDLRV
jgi:hypothetical protein